MSEQILQQILDELKDLKAGHMELSSKQEEFTSSLDRMSSKQEEFTSSLDRMSSKQEEFTSSLERMSSRQEEFSSRQDEMNQIVTALRSNQEVTNAKLDALTMDVRRIEGSTNRIEKRLDEQSVELRGDIRFLSHRVADLEMDVEKIKNR